MNLENLVIRCFLQSLSEAELVIGARVVQMNAPQVGEATEYHRQLERNGRS